MSTLIKQAIAAVEPRRTFLSQAGLLPSGTAIALLSGREALAAKADQAVESDLRILNTALGPNWKPSPPTRSAPKVAS